MHVGIIFSLFSTYADFSARLFRNFKGILSYVRIFLWGITENMQQIA